MSSLRYIAIMFAFFAFNVCGEDHIAYQRAILKVQVDQIKPSGKTWDSSLGISS